MAANGNESGSNDRATVALVAEKIDGLKALTHLGFTNVQRQLDELVEVPRELVELRANHDALARRVGRIEHDNERHIEWRRGPLLAGAIGVIALLLNFLH